MQYTNTSKVSPPNGKIKKSMEAKYNWFQSLRDKFMLELEEKYGPPEFSLKVDGVFYYKGDCGYTMEAKYAK